MRTPVTVGVVRSGSEAAAVTRAFADLRQSTLRWVCDDSNLHRPTASQPGPKPTDDFDQLLDDEELDAIAFASPALALPARVRSALEADKHVYIGGTLLASAAEAEALVAVAARRNRRLWARSPELFRPAARRLHALMERGALGEIFYLHAQRFVQADATGLDLLLGPGSEAVGLALHLLEDEPIEVEARAESYRDGSGPDLVFAKLRFATGIAVHLHVSRLEGWTRDRLSVVGSERTAVLDGSKRDRELALFVAADAPRSADDLSLEPGSMIALRLPDSGLTREACARFLTSVRSPEEDKHGHETALAVRVMEALDRSCVRGGTAESITNPAEPIPTNVVEIRAR